MLEYLKKLKMKMMVVYNIKKIVNQNLKLFSVFTNSLTLALSPKQPRNIV